MQSSLSPIPLSSSLSPSSLSLTPPQALRAVEASLPVCLSLVMPAAGPARATATNFVPTVASLRGIFFKDDHNAQV